MSDGSSFEQRLDELLKQEDRGRVAAGPDPAAVIAVARRRRARRRAGAGAAALAVALIAGGAALTQGDGQPGGGAVVAAGAPTAAGLPAASRLPGTGTPIPVDGTAPVHVPVAPEASAATPSGSGPKHRPDSPVKRVAPGEQVAIVDGFRMSVTATESCVEQWESATGTWEKPFGCRDATSDNLDHSRPTVGAQSSGDAQRTVVTGLYLGPAPATITVELNGTQVVATLVTTAGMEGWTAYYAVFPGAAPASSGPNGRTGSPDVAAWAADGTRLAALIDPRRPDPWATAGSGTGTPSAR
ncbi:hypothetical protein [Kitasatospora sp. NPDC001527]|uniref:hypothetical protein n=1 Tax=Kitasatospora sp. NPDC001527 TaxID=3154519 RepID=UPI0033314AEF